MSGCVSGQSISTNVEMSMIGHIGTINIIEQNLVKVNAFFVVPRLFKIFTDKSTPLLENFSIILYVYLFSIVIFIELSTSFTS